TSLLQFVSDQCRAVIAMWRARQKARRIVREELGKCVGHLAGEHVFAQPIPDVEDECAPGLQHPFGFLIGLDPVPEQHPAKLTADHVERRVIERQGLRIGLAPSNTCIAGQLRARLILRSVAVYAASADRVAATARVTTPVPAAVSSTVLGARNATHLAMSSA